VRHTSGASPRILTWRQMAKALRSAADPRVIVAYRAADDRYLALHADHPPTAVLDLHELPLLGLGTEETFDKVNGLYEQSTQSLHQGMLVKRQVLCSRNPALVVAWAHKWPSGTP
jgi:hypothetical protein